VSFTPPRRVEAGQDPRLEVPAPANPGLVVSLVKLARPHQWAKSVFVLLGPLYGLRAIGGGGSGGGVGGEVVSVRHLLAQALAAAAVFALCSSACYIFNDIQDIEKDRVHPRKRNRPLAAGHVPLGVAWAFMFTLFGGAAGLAFFVDAEHRGGLMLIAALYAANVIAYSAWLKHAVVADVISLSLGFVFRVIGGCVATAIAPSTWLLNVTLFLAMFLAFGKRLGERRTAAAAGYDASAARGVQAKYTDDLLRMSVVVTAVGTLLTYAGYVQGRESEFTFGLAPLGVGLGSMNWMWFSILPAMYGMLRAIVLLERGAHDDPTEMVVKDRALALAGVAFVVLSGLVIAMRPA
jgi:decaprenyl-phosphate phosphoribosyltransferase